MREPRHGDLAVYVLLGLAAVAVSSLAFRAPAYLAAFPLTEDGYFCLSIARSVGRGLGFQADASGATNGFQPLWPLLLAVPVWLGGLDDRALIRLTMAASAALAVAAALAWGSLSADAWRETARRRTVHVAAAAAVYLSSLQLLVQHFNGLETGLYLATAALVGLYYVRHGAATLGRQAALGALLGLLALVRIDQLVTAATVAAVVAAGERTWRARAQALVVVGGVALLVASPWLAFNVALTGHPVPVSGRALALMRGDGALGEFVYNGLGSLARDLVPHAVGEPLRLVAPALLAAFAACAIVVARRRAGDVEDGDGARAQRARAFVGALALSLALLFVYYVTTSGASYFFPRYFISAALPFVSAAAYLIAHSTRRRPAATALAAGALVLSGLVTVPLWHGAERVRPWAPQPSYSHEPALGQLVLLREFREPGETVGAFQTGTLAFFEDDVLNLDGRVNLDAYAARRDGRLLEYMLERGVEIVVDQEYFFLDENGVVPAGRFHAAYERVWPVQRGGLTDNAVFRRR